MQRNASAGWAESFVLTACLRVALLDVVWSAEHLAVVWLGLAALTPWRDVVSVHIRVLEVLLAEGTVSLLAFIGGKLRLLVELPEVQMLLVASQEVEVDALLALDL